MKKDLEWESYDAAVKRIEVEEKKKDEKKERDKANQKLRNHINSKQMTRRYQND